MTTEHIDSREVERLNEAISKLRDAALKQVEFQNSLIYQLKHTSRQRDQLLEALNEAKYLVADWGAYASPYFQEKHDLSGDIAKIEAVIATVEAGK